MTTPDKTDVVKNLRSHVPKQLLKCVERAIDDHISAGLVPGSGYYGCGNANETSPAIYHLVQYITTLRQQLAQAEREVAELNAIYEIRQIVEPEPGKLMLSELVEAVRQLQAERDKLRNTLEAIKIEVDNSLYLLTGKGQKVGVPRFNISASKWILRTIADYESAARAAEGGEGE